MTSITLRIRALGSKIRAVIRRGVVGLGALAALLVALSATPAPANAQSATPSPAKTPSITSAQVTGSLVQGGTLTMRVDALMPGGWRGLHLVEVSVLVNGSVVEHLVYDIEDDKLSVGDQDIARGTGAVAEGEYMEFLTEEPHAAQAMLRALARQVLSQEAFVEDLLYLDLKGRVAKRLLQLVSPSLDDLPDDGAVVPSIVTHADLASLCGGSRENVTRILSDFQRRGYVERDGRRFVLQKISGLARLAGL